MRAGEGSSSVTRRDDGDDGGDNRNGTDTTEELARLRSLGMRKRDLSIHAGLTRASVLIPLFEESSADNLDNPGKSKEHDDDDDGDDDAGDASDKAIDEAGGSRPRRRRRKANIMVLFTKRPMSMKAHPGEVCFPGGRQDPADEGDDVATAVRETREEVGISAEHIRCLCRLETAETLSGFCVTPVVAQIVPSECAEPSNLRNVSKREVESVFAVPLEYFYGEENCHSKEEIPFRGGTFVMRSYHYHYRHKNTDQTVRYKITGLTAHLAHQVAEIAFGEDPRHLETTSTQKQQQSQLPSP